MKNENLKLPEVSIIQKIPLLIEELVGSAARAARRIFGRVPHSTISRETENNPRSAQKFFFFFFFFSTSNEFDYVRTT